MTEMKRDQGQPRQMKENESNAAERKSGNIEPPAECITPSKREELSSIRVKEREHLLNMKSSVSIGWICESPVPSTILTLF